ncbi:hypothetical protein [Mycolicibacterium mengxianglii]|uniref:hypothetical protein n=1 Tax=Mycolicibacterium mengxianglii TaxID=2736649 RepID=UPI001E44CCEC|nr:hypothetical protein [Mycolicibacterium mengxianglii]
MTGQQQPPLAVARQRLADALADTPLRVAVHGLPGVGTSTVAAALTALGRFEVLGAGVCGSGPRRPDVTVRVVAEVPRPEDRQAAVDAAGPVLMVLTKADTCALGPGGPVATARRRCAEWTVPAEPLVGLLAVAALDAGVLDAPLLDAVRVLAVQPADLRTAETFVGGPHQLPAPVRLRLVDALDVFGIAHAVIAVRQHRDVHAALREASGVDAVAGRIAALGAEARYRRLTGVVAELSAGAVGDAALAELLTTDEVLLGRMAAASRVLRAAGVQIGPATGAEEHLREALRWRRYGDGPVTLLHRACAADVSRGSLRLWGAIR